MGVPDSGRSMEERRMVSGINIKKGKTANGQLVLSQRQEMWQKRYEKKLPPYSLQGISLHNPTTEDPTESINSQETL